MDRQQTVIEVEVSIYETDGSSNKIKAGIYVSSYIPCNHSVYRMCSLVYRMCSLIYPM